jgi:hypothetical protein
MEAIFSSVSCPCRTASPVAYMSASKVYSMRRWADEESVGSSPPPELATGFGSEMAEEDLETVIDEQGELEEGVDESEGDQEIEEGDQLEDEAEWEAEALTPRHSL